MEKTKEVLQAQNIRSAYDSLNTAFIKLSEERQKLVDENEKLTRLLKISTDDKATKMANDELYKMLTEKNKKLLDSNRDLQAYADYVKRKLDKGEPPMCYDAYK